MQRAVGQPYFFFKQNAFSFFLTFDLQSKSSSERVLQSRAILAAGQSLCKGL